MELTGHRSLRDEWSDEPGLKNFQLHQALARRAHYPSLLARSLDWAAGREGPATASQS